MKNCIICEKEFKPKSRTHKYCTEECRNTVYVIKKKEWQKNAYAKRQEMAKQNRIKRQEELLKDILPGEIWKDVEGHDGIYQISNKGRFRKDITLGGKGILNISKNPKTGYPTVNLNRKTYHVHRLLAEHFIDNPNNLQCVDHINRKKDDNRIENLRWVSFSGNLRNTNKHKNRKGTVCVQKRKYFSKKLQDYSYYEYPVFAWSDKNGKSHTKYFKTLEEAKEYQKNFTFDYHELLTIDTDDSES